jgi:hypothetical protein
VTRVLPPLLPCLIVSFVCGGRCSFGTLGGTSSPIFQSSIVLLLLTCGAMASLQNLRLRTCYRVKSTRLLWLRCVVRPLARLLHATGALLISVADIYVCVSWVFLVWSSCCCSACSLVESVCVFRAGCGYACLRCVQDVRGVIHALGSTSCVLMAHDWGAIVAWRFAAMHADMVDRLIIMNCPHPTCFKKNAGLAQLLRSWVRVCSSYIHAAVYE